MSKTKITMEDVDAELQKAFSKFPKLRLDRAWVRWIVRRTTRLGSVHKLSDNTEVQAHTLNHADVRIYKPKESSSNAGLFWIHGGGMILGDAKMNDAQCDHFSSDLKLTVVSANYRLAPKHSYPAAIDDCYEAWLWFVDNANELGVDTSRIAVAGQSAGGGLAAALCQRIRDEGGTAPTAQLLVYPMLDDRTANRTDLTEREHLVWNNRNNRYSWSAYLGREAGGTEPTPRWAVPGRCEDLSSLPPAWIGVGDLDLFLEENTDYSAALKAQGVPCELYISEKAPHGFEAMVPHAEVSQKFLAAVDDFLIAHLKL